MPDPANRFKDPLYIHAWLKAALKQEKEKYENCPVLPDMVPDSVNANGWGYVVIGYFLVEQSFKALLIVRGQEVPPIHSLNRLFDLLTDDDKDVLREYYLDCRATIGGNMGQFPFDAIDPFLKNLDGGTNERGNHIGSFDWRYFLIEEERSEAMPRVCIEYLHEITFGCIQILRFARIDRYNPYESTRSWRLREKRERKYQDWLSVRMTSVGWNDLGDRVEILWGPDYKDRYDLISFEGGGMTPHFAEYPTNSTLEVIDKRTEIEAYLSAT